MVTGAGGSNAATCGLIAAASLYRGSILYEELFEQAALAAKSRRWKGNARFCKYGIC